MSLEACADLVRTADPDRYAVTIIAPEEAQKILWPLYAFNVEVSRAPWVTQEPLIAEIRLQWWRDALEEIREGKPVRSHALTEPLAAVLDAEGAMLLDTLVDARKWDIYPDPFNDQSGFDAYIDKTAGGLMWTAARLLGADGETSIRNYAASLGTASFLRAVPELKSRGRKPLIKDDVETFSSLAKQGAQHLADAKRLPQSSVSARNALLPCWWLNAFYHAALSRTDVVYREGWQQSEFARRWGLFKAGFGLS